MAVWWKFGSDQRAEIVEHVRAGGVAFTRHSDRSGILYCRAGDADVILGWIHPTLSTTRRETLLRARRRPDQPGRYYALDLLTSDECDRAQLLCDRLTSAPSDNVVSQPPDNLQQSPTTQGGLFSTGDIGA